MKNQGERKRVPDAPEGATAQRSGLALKPTASLKKGKKKSRITRRE